MSLTQEMMLRITGYTDKCSVRPGDELSFHIHSEYNESYEAQIVRLIHGDTNPDGPGFKEKLVRAPVRMVALAEVIAATATNTAIRWPPTGPHARLSRSEATAWDLAMPASPRPDR